MKRRSFLGGLLALVSFGCAKPKQLPTNMEVVYSPYDLHQSKIIRTALVELSDENPSVSRMVLFPDCGVNFKTISKNVIEVTNICGTKERLCLYKAGKSTIVGASKEFWKETQLVTFFKITYNGLSTLWRPF